MTEIDEGVAQDLLKSMERLSRDLTAHAQSDARHWEMIQSDISEIRGHVKSLDDRVSDIERKDYREIDKRLDSLEKDRATAKGIAGGIGLGSGLLGALLERLLG